jgi:hypothetical protein
MDCTNFTEFIKAIEVYIIAGSVFQNKSKKKRMRLSCCFSHAKWQLELVQQKAGFYITALVNTSEPKVFVL